MFVELVDVLRCNEPHDETWLVLSADRTRDRDIEEGTLGCPVCRREYVIRAGVGRFGEPANAPPRRGPARSDAAMRIAALLGLTEPRGYVLLAGSLADHASVLRAIVPIQVLVLNPPIGTDLGGGISAIEVADRAPLAPGSAGGAAVDESVPDALLASIAAAVRPGGRLLAPALRAMPPGYAEVARDESDWLAERERGVSAPVALGRRA